MVIRAAATTSAAFVGGPCAARRVAHGQRVSPVAVARTAAAAAGRWVAGRGAAPGLPFLGVRLAGAATRHVLRRSRARGRAQIWVKPPYAAERAQARPRKPRRWWWAGEWAVGRRRAGAACDFGSPGLAEQDYTAACEEKKGRI